MAGGWLSRAQDKGECVRVWMCAGEGVLMNRGGELVRASEMDKRRRIHKGGEDRWIGVGRNTRNRCQSSLMRSPHRLPGSSGRTIERRE